MEQANEPHLPLTMSLTTASPAATASTTAAPLNERSFIFVVARLRMLALPGLFAWFGLVMGSWAGRIPALREDLHVSHPMLSFVLLCGGAGAILSFPLSSRLMAGFGARNTMLIAGGALLIVLMGIGLEIGRAHV